MNASEAQHGINEVIESVCQSKRTQPYRLIHKALRALLTEALVKAGSLDVSFEDDRNELVEIVEKALSVCCDHLTHENRFFHEPLKEIAGRQVAPFYDDHLDHLRAIGEMRLLLQRVRDAGREADLLAYHVYLKFSSFVGENFEHMAEEETVLTRVLWDHFTDEQINALEGALQETLSPEESTFYLRWMAKSLNSAELDALMRAVRKGAPIDVFTSIKHVVIDELAGNRLDRLLIAMETNLSNEVAA